MQATPLPPSPHTTLVILLGASEWPFSPEFHASQAFKNSASAIAHYFLDPTRFGLPQGNVLNLFDSEHSPDDIDTLISRFLDLRMAYLKKTGNAARDLILYFVGHGGFTRGDLNYYLAIRRTRMDNPLVSSIQISSLAYTMKEKARYLRRFILLDCCFAASASQFFQSAEPTQASIKQTADAFKTAGVGTGFPTRGTSLLCSSRHNTPSLLSPNNQYTMFSEALLHALQTDHQRFQTGISLRTVAGLAEEFLDHTYGDKGAPRPEVHSPDQSEGDLAEIPLFPVATRSTSTLPSQPAAFSPSGATPVSMKETRSHQYQPASQAPSLKEAPGHGQSLGAPEVASPPLRAPETSKDTSNFAFLRHIPFMNHAVECVCPSCFHTIDLGGCCIVSGLDGQIITHASPQKRISVEPLTGQRYTSYHAQRQCYNCQYLLPYNMEQASNIFITIAGNISSGQSQYMAALIKDFENSVILHSQAQVSCLTADVRHAYQRELIDPLFNRKEVLPPTQLSTGSSARPLIYELSLRRKASRKKVYNLLLYHTCGEDYSDQARLTHYAVFALHAHAFIFVIDPLTMPDVMYRLPSSLIGDRVARVYEHLQTQGPAYILNTIMPTYQRFHDNKEVSAPIAIMLSKADLLASHMPPDKYKFIMDPPYNNRLEVSDWQRVDAEIQWLLRTMRQENMLTVAHRFRHVSFFATSATGGPPDPQGRFTDIHPVRCLDPLLWILYKYNILS